MTVVEPLSAPIELAFDYTRSLGSTLSRFVTGLANRTVVGARAADGLVYVPPLEYDPVTHEPLTDFVEVADRGTVLTWTWTDDPLPGQPLDRPFAWALIRLDGADTGFLHAVAADSPDAIRTGLRVRAGWAGQRRGPVRDIAFFVPGAAAPGVPAAVPADGSVELVEP